MHCDCRECSKSGRVWAWLEGTPGPVSSFITFGCLAGALLAGLWWGRL